MQETEQIKFWQGDFGKEYIERNNFTVRESDANHLSAFGVSRSTLNELFFGSLSRDIRILEVGCNIGQQLRHLQLMGFKNLYGVDVQDRAVIKANALSQNIEVKKGSILEIPFEDNEFDLVFTSVVLIHVHPKDLDQAMKEMYRCTKQYIWGWEYYADRFQEVPYRGHTGFLWKGDYGGRFKQNFPDLTVVKELKIRHLDEETVDQSYLLRKDELQKPKPS